MDIPIWILILLSLLSIPGIFLAIILIQGIAEDEIYEYWERRRKKIKEALDKPRHGHSESLINFIIDIYLHGIRRGHFPNESDLDLLAKRLVELGFGSISLAGEMTLEENSPWQWSYQEWTRARSLFQEYGVRLRFPKAKLTFEINVI